MDERGAGVHERRRPMRTGSLCSLFLGLQLILVGRICLGSAHCGASTVGRRRAQIGGLGKRPSNLCKENGKYRTRQLLVTMTILIRETYPSNNIHTPAYRRMRPEPVPKAAAGWRLLSPGFSCRVLSCPRK